MDYSDAILAIGAAISLAFLAGYSYSLNIMRNRVNAKLEVDERVPYYPRPSDTLSFFLGADWLAHRRRIRDLYREYYPNSNLPTLHRWTSVAYVSCILLTVVALFTFGK